MKYYLGEIYCTHKKFMGIWWPYTNRLTSVLIEAEDWMHAKRKADMWFIDRTIKLRDQWRFILFCTTPI